MRSAIALLAVFLAGAAGAAETPKPASAAGEAKKAPAKIAPAKATTAKAAAQPKGEKTTTGEKVAAAKPAARQAAPRPAPSRPAAPANLHAAAMNRGAEAMETNMVGMALSEMMVPARAGDARAQYNVGRIYADRLEVDWQGQSRNSVEGVRWLRAAANQGYVPAMQQLADMYQSGRGVPQDSREAARWREAIARRLAPPPAPAEAPKPAETTKLDWAEPNRAVLTLGPNTDTAKLTQQLKEVLQQRRMDQIQNAANAS